VEVSVIKGVIFDYGGTLTRDGSFKPVYERLAEKLGKDVEYVRTLMKHGVGKFLRGQISEDEFWKILEAEHGSPIGAEDRNVWVSWAELEPDPLMVDLVARLRSDGYKLAVLSNATQPSAEIIRNHGGYEGFDEVVLSCEIGYAKPEIEMYKQVLDMLGLEAQECLFVDDQQRILDPAIELGMQTVLATEPAGTVEAVEAALGVKV
jgi:putative hydrolase of the HAD superfamily